MISDAWDPKEVDGIVYEVDSATINIRPGADVDIGANPSAEGGEEELDEGMISVNNVVHSFQLQETSFDKKSFMTYLKGYMKKVKAYLDDKHPDQADAFVSGAQAYVKKLIANFSNYQFFTGESMDPDGMIVLMDYREDGTTPYLIFWKHGLEATKY
jgi:hypothetical protein